MIRFYLQILLLTVSLSLIVPANVWAAGSPLLSKNPKHKIVITDSLGRIEILSLPDRSRKVLPIGSGYESAKWITLDGVANRYLLAGRGRTDGVDGDDGLWLIDTMQQNARQIEPAEDIDFVAYTSIEQSPDSHLIAIGVGDSSVHIIANSSWHMLKSPRDLRLAEVVGFRWLNNYELIVTVATPDMPFFKVAGGTYIWNTRNDQFKKYKTSYSVKNF